VTAEKPIDDDPVIRRVAAIRPSIPEDDLWPGAQRAQAIAERVLAGSPPIPAARSGGRRARPRWALPWGGLALALAAVAIVLLLAGTFSGPDSSGTQPAAAAVIRATLRALAPSPGKIFIEDETYVSGPMVHGHPYTLDQVLETPSGPGPQNQLTTTDNPEAVFGQGSTLSGASYVGGTQEIYSATTNTIYVSSIWGPYLRPGPRPGTFVYQNAAGAPTYAQRPMIVTARQRRALLHGQACIRLTSKTVGSKVEILGLRVLPPLRGPAQYAQSLQQELANRNLHLVGRTRVDGRDAIELAGKTTDGSAPGVRLYFDPTTHLLFEEVDSVGTRRQQVIHVSLHELPVTRTSERLLSLRARHPTARIDRSHRDYLKAAHGIVVFPQ
jgi:hypothetical protein